ncbi:hypothetical protein [Sphingobium chungbukense]|uniref:Uncharacterized protein n=1 Tax=Sphingobium chungbukense TaxID=56193 RepID=A0A0M3AQL0_9SPHN|nr:hypothetical protein [Sphingobium chungbukense]KKW92497.1 hypothetical protein YP76_05935 [Sphingobium chungbukense]
MGADSTDRDDGRIDALIGRLAPEPVCDDCVAERLGLATEPVTHRAHALAGIAGYQRAGASCTLCATVKVTTRLVRR